MTSCVPGCLCMAVYYKAHGQACICVHDHLILHLCDSTLRSRVLSSFFCTSTEHAAFWFCCFPFPVSSRHRWAPLRQRILFWAAFCIWLFLHQLYLHSRVSRYFVGRSRFVLHRCFLPLLLSSSPLWTMYAKVLVFAPVCLRLWDEWGPGALART
jgi:hypothetical protein